MEDQLRTFRRFSRVFPTVPYARHASRVGCSVVADLKSSPHSSSAKSHGNGTSVKILALLCSKQNVDTSGSTAPVFGPVLSPTCKRARDDAVGKVNADEKHPKVEIVSAKASAIGSEVEEEALVRSGQEENSSGVSPSTHTVDAHTNSKEIKDASATSTAYESEHTTVSGTPAKSHLYVRVQYDRALITTLPIEVMRKQHPQVLIDYLLSMSVWA